MYVSYQSFKYVIKKWIASLNFTFHLQYKYPGTFANRKYEKLSYPKNPKMCDPILVTLLKMQPQYSQSSRENAHPHQPSNWASKRDVMEIAGFP